MASWNDIKLGNIEEEVDFEKYISEEDGSVNWERARNMIVVNKEDIEVRLQEVPVELWSLLAEIFPEKVGTVDVTEQEFAQEVSGRIILYSPKSIIWDDEDAPPRKLSVMREPKDLCINFMHRVILDRCQWRAHVLGECICDYEWPEAIDLLKRLDTLKEVIDMANDILLERLGIR